MTPGMVQYSPQFTDDDGNLIRVKEVRSIDAKVSLLFREGIVGDPDRELSYCANNESDAMAVACFAGDL